MLAALRLSAAFAMTGAGAHAQAAYPKNDHGISGSGEPVTAIRPEPQ
jgi:hypothetical protein